MTGATGWALRNGAEVFRQQRLQAAGIEVAGNGDRGVVRRVELLVKIAHIGNARGLDIGVAADDIAVVGMALGKEACENCSSAT
jgi:hypothetical protein